MSAFVERAETALWTFCWLAAIFYPLSWALQRRKQRFLRAGFAADLCFFLGQRLVFSAVVVATLTWLAGHLDGHTVELRVGFAALPLWLQAATALMAGDFIVYWGHRLQHSWEPLWRIHAVHHTTEHLDWLAAHREHPLDGLQTETLLNLPAILLGLPMDYVLGLVTFRALWAVLIHANVRLPMGPLRYLVGSPALHQWHHAKDRHVGNYANLAPWLDVVFGTYALPEGDPAELGIDEEHPRDYLGLLLWPFRRRAAPSSKEIVPVSEVA